MRNGFDPLAVLREANEQLPSIKYAWGIVGLAAASAIAIFLHGDGKSAAVSTGVAFVGFVLVLLATIAAKQRSHLLLPAKVVIWATTVLFVFFLALTATVYAISWPCNWAGFIGVETKECDPIITRAEKELWSKNWEILKQERSNRESRNCNGMDGEYKVYNRRQLLNSLSALDFGNNPDMAEKRDRLLGAIREAQRVTNDECPTLGDYPNIDLLMEDPIRADWESLKSSVKSKASAAGVDLTFKWDV